MPSTTALAQAAASRPDRRARKTPDDQSGSVNVAFHQEVAGAAKVVGRERILADERRLTVLVAVVQQALDVRRPSKGRVVKRLPSLLPQAGQRVAADYGADADPAVVQRDVPEPAAVERLEEEIGAFQAGQDFSVAPVAVEREVAAEIIVLSHAAHPLADDARLSAGVEHARRPCLAGGALLVGPAHAAHAAVCQQHVGDLAALVDINTQLSGALQEDLVETPALDVVRGEARWILLNEIQAPNVSVGAPGM